MLRICRCALPPCWPKPRQHWTCSAVDELSLVLEQAPFVRVLRPWEGLDAARASRLRHWKKQYISSVLSGVAAVACASRASTILSKVHTRVHALLIQSDSGLAPMALARWD